MHFDQPDSENGGFESGGNATTQTLYNFLYSLDSWREKKQVPQLSLTRDIRKDGMGGGGGGRCMCESESGFECVGEGGRSARGYWVLEPL